MINKFKILLIFFFSFFYYFDAHTQNIKIIVKVENELITSYDIKSKIITTLVLNNKEINQKNIDSLKKVSLDFLIQNRLKKIELEKTNLKKPSIQINSYLQNISSNNIENLKKLFEANNLDFKIFEDELETEIKWKNFIYNIYAKKISIDENDIDEEIKKIISNKKKVISYNLSDIEILLNDGDNYDEIVKLIKNEISTNGFISAVLKFSVSSSASAKGELGWVNSNSLSKDILKIVEEMKIGEVSLPLKEQNRLIFLKLNDKKISDHADINIDELKKDLIDKKREEIFKLYSNSYLSKLKNSKVIQFNK